MLRLLLCLLLIAGAARGEVADPPEPVDFTKDVRPIFEQRCVKCHGKDRQEGDLRLDNFDEARRGGHTGSPILGGALETNAILQRVATEDVTIRMPKDDDPLSAEQISILRRWVRQGTPWMDPAETVEPRGSPDTPQFAFTWAAWPGWNPYHWPDALLHQIVRGMYRIGLPFCALLVLIGLCERARLWVRLQRPWVVPPRGGWLRALAAVPRSWFLVATLLFAIVFWIAFYQSTALRADGQVAALQQQVSSLRAALNGPPPGANGEVHPVRPPHPPRLGGEYYRGNDERNPELFNGGFYRTAVMRVALCRKDRSVLAWGDEVHGPTAWIKFEIEQAPSAASALFADQIWDDTYLSERPVGYRVETPEREVIRFAPVGRRQWAAYYPIDLPASGTGQVKNTISIYRGSLSDGKIAGQAHYAAEYSLQLTDGRIEQDSELWMGYVFRTGNVATVPPGKIPEDEWFSFRPIPEIEGDQTTTDTRLLGIDDYKDELDHVRPPAQRDDSKSPPETTSSTSSTASTPANASREGAAPNTP